mmetsp:Transcript_8156/g.15135  ORF Transcript_8156/g.15135 Transcript_8156/m.15135 type:complete len:210 (+) Transcript_8156:447-1076(+)
MPSTSIHGLSFRYRLLIAHTHAHSRCRMPLRHRHDLYAVGMPFKLRLLMGLGRHAVHALWEAAAGGGHVPFVCSKRIAHARRMDRARVLQWLLRMRQRFVLLDYGLLLLESQRLLSDVSSVPSGDSCPLAAKGVLDSFLRRFSPVVVCRSHHWMPVCKSTPRAGLRISFFVEAAKRLVKSMRGSRKTVVVLVIDNSSLLAMPWISHHNM